MLWFYLTVMFLNPKQFKMARWLAKQMMSGNIKLNEQL